MNSAAPVAVPLTLPLTAQAGCHVSGRAVLPLTVWDEKMFIPVEIDRTEVQLFVETGAAGSTLSQATSNALNLPRNLDHSADAFGVGGVEARDVADGGLPLGPHTFAVARFRDRMLRARHAGRHAIARDDHSGWQLCRPPHVLGGFPRCILSGHTLRQQEYARKT